MILRALLLIYVAQAMEEGRGKALDDTHNADEVGQTKWYTPLIQNAARLRNACYCKRRRPTEEKKKEEFEMAVDALTNALEKSSADISNPRLTAEQTIKDLELADLSQPDISYLVANAMPKKPMRFSEMNLEQLKDVISKMGHLADPDVLGLHLANDYYHATKKAVEANPGQKKRIYFKAITKVIVAGTFALLCMELQPFFEHKFGRIKTQPSITTLMWQVPALMAVRMILSGTCVTFLSAMTSALLGYLIPDPVSKVGALLLGNWVAALIPLGLYNLAPKFYKKYVLWFISSNPMVSWVWQLTFAYNPISKAGIAGILIGHAVVGGGCVAYWFQPDISNSVTDMWTFGSTGLSEDIFLVLFGAQATVTSYAVLGAGFISVNAMKIGTTPSYAQKGIATLKIGSIAFLLYELSLGNATGFSQYLNSIPFGVKPVGAIYCVFSLAINAPAHFLFGADTYKNFDHKPEALLNTEA